MTRWALIAALAAALALGGLAWWQSSRAASLADEVARQSRSIVTLEAARAQRDEAARVAAARAARWETRAAELDATVQSILTADLGECADARLHDDLLDLLGRSVRPAD